MILQRKSFFTTRSPLPFICSFCFHLESLRPPPTVRAAEISRLEPRCFRKQAADERMSVQRCRTRLPLSFLSLRFLTLFVTSLPLRSVCVLWDFLLGEGLHGLLELAVALLKVLTRFIIHLRQAVHTPECTVYVYMLVGWYVYSRRPFLRVCCCRAFFCLCLSWFPELGYSQLRRFFVYLSPSPCVSLGLFLCRCLVVYLSASRYLVSRQEESQQTRVDRSSFSLFRLTLGHRSSHMYQQR